MNMPHAERVTYVSMTPNNKETKLNKRMIFRAILIDWIIYLSIATITILSLLKLLLTPRS
jgi:hypothetical protein